MFDIYTLLTRKAISSGLKEAIFPLIGPKIVKRKMNRVSACRYEDMKVVIKQTLLKAAANPTRNHELRLAVKVEG